MGECLQGFRIPRRSAPPPSPPPLPLRWWHNPAAPFFLSPSLTMWFLLLLLSFSFHTFFFLSLRRLPYRFANLPAVPQCVCTLSPSPSKQPKPIPLDSLQLPLAPGLVTHTVSLNGLLLWEWTLLVIWGFSLGSHLIFASKSSITTIPQHNVAITSSPWHAPQ